MVIKSIQGSGIAQVWAVFDNNGNNIFAGSIEDATAFYNSNKDDVIEDTFAVDGALVNKQRVPLSNIKLNLGWKDLIARFASQKTNATNEPTWEDVGNGIFLYSFVNGNEVFAQYHIGHDYKPTTKAFAHIHFFAQGTMAVGETVEWTFKYSIAKGHQQGESLTGTPTSIIMTYTADGTEVAGEHIILECSELQAFELIEADAVLLTSITKTGGTHIGKIFGIMADIHYQSDFETTINKAPNFYE